MANVAGFYVYFVFRLKEIKREMKAALKDFPVEKLQRLTMTSAEFQKAKNDEGEVKWNGFMYDVARVEVSSNTITVFALRDEAETDLLAFFHKVIEMSGQDEQHPPNSLTEFLSLSFTVPIPASLTEKFVILPKQRTPFTKIKFVSPNSDVESPPPRG